MWGDSDAVSPMSIPQTISKLINPQYLTFNTLPGAGKQLFVTLPVSKIYKYVKHKFFRSFLDARKPKTLDRLCDGICK